MDKTKRKAVIAGNWKMNKTAAETAALIDEMKEALPSSDCRIILCVPAINIPIALETADGSQIKIGAQNCHWEKSGAYTGEISRDMLTAYGVKYSVIGHSERRQYFGETDETVNKRALACLGGGITPIICVGEDLAQREGGLTDEVIKTQTVRALAGFTKEDILNSIIAYEPVWAIGTGKTATSEQAQQVCALIRGLLAQLFDRETAEKISILYGGSMNAGNAADLLAMKDIDGGLIGGASLKSNDFATIVAAAK